MNSENMIQGDGHSIEYNENTQTIVFAGSMRLRTSADYAPVLSLLEHAYSNTDADTLILDFRQLEFLNSSGINTISRFVITARKSGGANLSVLGNPDIYWQQKSLVNLQRLWPNVLVKIE
jgi:hypothetical protein